MSTIKNTNKAEGKIGSPSAIINFGRLFVKKYFNSLSHTNFRIFWFGQIISLTGSWMQTISLPWLAYTITKSPFLLGVVGALQFTPMLFLSLFAGVWVDRFEKKKIIIFTQISLSVLAFVLAFLTLSNSVRYWHLVIIAAVLGLINSIDMPARQTFITEMVGKKDLLNAIGLNSTIFNGARIAGPAIAGITMAGLGTGYCFLINALSFIPVIIGLFYIKPEFSYISKSSKKIFREIKDGIKYIFTEEMLLRTIITVLIVGTFIMNFSVLVPVLTKNALKMGETGFGFLMSCMGIGSFFGALAVAAGSRHSPKGIILNTATFLVSIVFILIGFNTSFIFTAVLLALAGFLTVSFLITANSTLQLNSKDEFRSRVISVYVLVNAGTTPFGNLITGSLTDLFGIRSCFIILGAGVFILISIVFLSGIHRKKSYPHPVG